MIDPTLQTTKLVRLCIILGISTALALPAAVIAISAALSKRVIVIGATDSGRFIPVVSLDKPYVNEPRVQAFAEECLRQSFAHDFRHFRRTVGEAQSCYTNAAADQYVTAMGPLLSDIDRRRLVMSSVVEKPPVVVRTFLLNGVYTWDLEARVAISREGTRERVPPVSYDVEMRITRAHIEESVRGVLISKINLKPPRS